jgi:tetratricopeptide (TPR) repeat protein
MKRNFYSVAKILSAVLIFSNSVMPAVANKVPEANLTQISDKANDDALTAQMKQIEGAIKEGIAKASARYKAISDPQSFIASLPSKETVVKTKDAQKFREYGGLSEVYLFNNKVLQAESLRSWVVANAAEVLGADDPNPALIDSDFALFYYDSGNLSRAESLFKETMPLLEAAMSAKPDQVRNNLISVYAGLAEIAFNRGQKEEAQGFINKITQITPAQ